MPQDNLLMKMHLVYPSLTKLEKKVADFVFSAPQDVVKMTINDLASHCEVGDTTVFRFCRSMALDGYQSFKLSLALSLHINEVLDSRNNVNIAASQDLREVVAQVSALLTDTVSDAVAILDYAAVARTVELMLKADSIHLFGFGNSGIAARLLQNRLIRVLPNISYVGDAHMQLTSASLLWPDSLAIVFCNSGVTVDCIKIVQMAHEAGASTVFVTNFLQTPAREYADVLLPCGAA
ncbi:MAG: MurR/RpiR family transcriptional regulator, partial [Clostridia bacterium]